MRMCKTPALGGRAIVCKSCDHHHYIYHSCGHSHCPICQSIKREQWVDKLKNELLNTAYIHMVFTLPHELNGLARNNKKVIYSLIMQSGWKTVKVLSKEKNNIGGLPGMISVLHTFGSDMKYHIHTHCLVTFGGLDENGNWQLPKRKEKIARYRQIKGTYKKVFLEGLSKLYRKSKIEYHMSYEELLEMVDGKTWVVHNTKPTMDTSVLEDYLARYINRVAVSNSKVEYIKEQSIVKLIYNDYANQKEGEAAPKKKKKIDPLVFIDQFMQHVLPPSFQKSRRYGLHASSTKRKYQNILPDSIKRNGHHIRTVFQILTQLIKENPFHCEKCNSEKYEIVVIRPTKSWIHKYIQLPTSRAPPIKSAIL